MTFPDENPILGYSHLMRSRYGETDKMGYVYYGKYLEFFEVARTEMVRTMDLNYADLESRGIMLPVIQAEIEYNQPVFYDEQMEIEVLMYEKPAVRLKTYYRVWTERTDRSHVDGKVTLVFIDEKNRKPVRAPQIFMDKFNQASQQYGEHSK